jgi:hypothetical protein
MITPVKHSVFTLFSQLIRNIHATVTKNAARHVKLYIWTEVVLFESTPFKFVPCCFGAVLVAEILQVTFARLVADWAIQRMIDEKQFNYTFACLQHFFAGDVLHFHSLHDVGAAACNKFGHRARIGFATFGNFHQAGTTFTTTSLQPGVITHCRRNHVAADGPCCLQDAGARFNLNGDVVDFYCYQFFFFRHFSNSKFKMKNSKLVSMICWLIKKVKMKNEKVKIFLYPILKDYGGDDL